MSQPTDYQYRTYANDSSMKSGPPQMVNGQASATHHNGMQSTNYNFTGVMSSQSSRDPSPTPYLYNQYRSPLPRPPMSPLINGQQNSMNPVMPPPARLPQSQQQPPMYNVQNQFQVPATQHPPPPRNDLVNPPMEPPKPPTTGFDQNLSPNPASEAKPYNVDSQDNTVQGTQLYSQEQNKFPNPMQPPRGQPPYQQNFGGQRMYAKNAHVMQHAATVPNTMSYGPVGSGPQMQAKLPPPPPTAAAEYPAQRTYPIQQQNPMNKQLDPMAKHYQQQYPDQMNQLNNQMNMMNVTQAGYNKLWGMESIDLLQCRNVLPSEKVEPPKIKLHQEYLESINCSPDIFRCTLTKIPESNALLQKSRLPLGVLIHPFKDLNHLPVIQCSTIVRCRACRTYINPFVYFSDSKRWKCCLCFRINELPEEFQFDPVTNTYGDPSRRPEVKTSTIEFIAPSEYMLRPPQPAVYLFVLDVSRLAVESGYLNIVCNAISQELSRLPGDSRTQIGFLAVDSAIHFFSIPDNVSQPQEMIILDIDDVFLPCPDNLIVNLKEREELVRDLLTQLPTKFQGTHDTNSALGAALQAAYKLMSSTGGRVTVFQTCLPNIGPGLLQAREDPNSRASKDVPHLNPATDFYKRLALDCRGQQIAVDLFPLNSQYVL